MEVEGKEDEGSGNEDGPATLYSFCEKILPTEEYSRVAKKYGGEQGINRLGSRLKPNTIWGSSAIGTFSDIVGRLFHHILVNGKAGEPAAADILKSVLHGSRSNKQFNTVYKSVIEGVSKNPNPARPSSISSLSTLRR
jgi:hypothetical protein